jgi:hypothetical protein
MTSKNTPSIEQGLPGWILVAQWIPPVSAEPALPLLVHLKEEQLRIPPVKEHHRKSPMSSVTPMIRGDAI